MHTTRQCLPLNSCLLKKMAKTVMLSRRFIWVLSGKSNTRAGRFVWQWNFNWSSSGRLSNCFHLRLMMGGFTLVAVKMPPKKSILYVTVFSETTLKRKSCPKSDQNCKEKLWKTWIILWTILWEAYCRPVLGLWQQTIKKEAMYRS